MKNITLSLHYIILIVKYKCPGNLHEDHYVHELFEHEDYKSKKGCATWHIY